MVTLILLLIISFTAVFAEDPDYGSTWETAGLITPDSTLYVGVLGEGDEDWFYFPQTGNKRYRFTITDPQSGYKYMKVYLLDEFNLLKEQLSLSAWTNTLQSQPFFEYDYDVYIKVYGEDIKLYLEGDANRDCVVDLLDVGVMTTEWLTDTNP
jgi:hypothetical protein